MRRKQPVHTLSPTQIKKRSLVQAMKGLLSAKATWGDVAHAKF